MNSIERDVFRPLTQLVSITMPSDCFVHITRRQGIDWTRAINADRGANEEEKWVEIFLSNGIYGSLNVHYEYFRDEDFCLYVRFPFELVVFRIMMGNIDARYRRDLSAYSCLTQWIDLKQRLMDHQSIFWSWISKNNFNNSKTTKCNFSQLLERCQKDEFPRRSRSTHFRRPRSFEFMLSVESALILASPVVSLVGIFFNSRVIRVLVKKQFKKEFAKKQYTYMIVQSVANIFICSIEIVSLVNECQKPFVGLICSSIHTDKFVQYWKLVVGEFFGNFFITMSNLAYVAFAIARLSLVGKRHSSLIQFVSDVNVAKLVAVCVLVSTLVSLVKPFRYIIEIPIISYNLDYPFLFTRAKNVNALKKPVNMLMFVSNVIEEFVNYCLFVVVNLCVDLVLLQKLRQVMREKEARTSEMMAANEKGLERVRQENEKHLREVIKLVVLNSFANISLKMPISITSLNDLRILIFNVNFFSKIKDMLAVDSLTFPYSMRYFCYLEKVCQVFKRFGHVLFIVSMSLNFLFLKRFDKNFQLAIETNNSTKKNKCQNLKQT